MRAHRVDLQKYFLAATLFILGMGIGEGCVWAGQETPGAGGNPGQSAGAARAVKKTAAPNQGSVEQGAETENETGVNGQDDITKRAEWFYKQRSSVNGRLPAGARQKAFEHVQQMMVAEGKLKQRVDGTYAEVMPESGTSTTTWTSIGPSPTLGSSFGPVTGRITTIAVDPTDSTGNTVLIGGAQGGIWRTTDGGTTWTAQGDQNASLAMGSIAFAPSQPATVYAGTGEQASIGFDVYYGAGVLISSDSGRTWRQTCTVASATCPFIGPYNDITPFGFFTLGGTRISYVSVNPSHPNMVLVAAQTQFVQGTTEGVYCSDNSGATWSNILPDEMSTFVGFASSSVAYAALGNPFGSANGTPNGNGIYKATSIGTTCSTIHFTRLVSTSLPLQSTMGRIDLGIAPSDGNTVYASIADGTNGSATNLGVYVTTDGGTNWATTQAPDVCRQQCWYDNVVKVDPNNKQIVFFAGGAVTTGGAPFWVVRTKTGGTSWSSAIPNVAPPNAGVPHVDSHAIAFVKLPTGKVRAYLGNDGGIWRTDDAEATSVTWTNLNGSALTLSQFYPAISIHPSSPSIAVGGTQDNGTQSYGGAATWANLNICGDGTGTAIDAMVPSTVYIACNGPNVLASYQNGQTGTFSLAVNGINGSDYSNFVPPLVVDPEQPGVVYLGTTTVYQSVDSGNNWTTIQAGLGNGGSQTAITALAVAPTNSKSLYAGMSTGQIFVTSDVTSGNGMQAVPGQGSLPPRTVSAIAGDPADATGQTAYAAFSGFSFVVNTSGFFVNDPIGHIFKTTDRGATWVDVSCSVANCMTPAGTDLPNIPVNDVVVDPDVPGTIYAATDLGVFVGTCTGTPCGTWTWSTLGAGLPRVAVLSLKLHEASRTLRAATHGRGVWDIVLNNFSFGAGPHITSLSPTTSTAGGSSLTLTVTGSGLTGGTIQFGATALAGTGTASDTTLSGTVPTGLLTIGTPVITVKNPSNVVSNGLKFVVTGGQPTLTNIAPGSTPVQANPVTNIPVTLTGTNFTAGSKVFWNGAAAGIRVTVNSATSIAATLPGGLLGPFGSTNDVSVLSAPPGGGQSSAVTFKVAAPPPPNDNFANAINVTTFSFVDDKDSSAATTESGEAAPVCVNQYTVAQGNTGGHPNGAYNTIWYKFTPTFSANLSLDTIGSSYDTTLSIWSGTQGNLTSVACNDDIVSGVNTQSQLINLALTAGTTYYIAVGSFGPPDPNPIALGGHAHLDFSYNFGQNPAAKLTTISPTSANSGDPAVNMTLTGSNFLSGAQVLFIYTKTGAASFLPTNFVSSTQLTATLAASLITLPGQFQVQVLNPQPSSGPSNALNFTVNLGTYPVPSLTSIDPTSVIATNPGIRINAFGSNFAPTAVLTFNGISQTTSVIDSQQLFATVPASQIGVNNVGTVQVTVTNPTPGGGTSASIPFSIQQPSVVPTIASVSPTSTPANPANSVPITVTGTNFQQGVIILFNGWSQQTTFVSATQLTGAIFPSFLTSGGVFPIQVVDPYPGGYSNTVNFTVTAPILPSIAVGESAVTLNSSTGASQSSTVTVSASGGFSGPVSVICPEAMPPGVLCGNSPLTIMVPNGSTSATGQLTVSVLATSGTLSASAVPKEYDWQAAGLLSGRGGKEWWGLSAFIGAGALLLMLLPGKNKAWSVLGLSLVCVLTFAMGCGGSGGGGGGGGRVSTQTRLTAANGKVASGSPFNFNVTVTGGAPAGQVLLLEGGTALGTAVVSGGTASIQTAALAVGTHSINASYQGDANTYPSSSGILHVTVTGTTSIAITTNPVATPAVPPISLTIN
ncbi:MAG TPA: Ig-like domain repeat protein [Candidatus Acidoferrum sp.]|nr:Ig-like domain repeat protein [Candidatus Acidoferrum sp.]